MAIEYKLIADYHGGTMRIEQAPLAPHHAVPIPRGAPAEISQWLYARGWSGGPDGQTWLNPNSGNGYFTWEQAMAVEFHRFINLGAK